PALPRAQRRAPRLVYRVAGPGAARRRPRPQRSPRPGPRWPRHRPARRSPRQRQAHLRRPGRGAGPLRPLRAPVERRPRTGPSRRAGVVDPAPHRLLPHRLVRAARGSAGHARDGAQGRGELMARFGTVLTAMVTPFDDDGRLDLDGAATLARWLVDRGSEGLVVAGTTGEAPVLSDQEKRDLWSAGGEAVTVQVIEGDSMDETAHI